MESYRIDSHKLLFHPRRVARWLDGETIPPVYMEVSPSGACNHRCVFCALDFMEYQRRFLDTELLCQRLAEMAVLGLKSVMFGGEGEPFLHANMAAIAERANAAGLDLAFTTNATLMDEENTRRVLPVTRWIKASVNAGTPETYAQVHQTKPEHFTLAIANLERAATLRAKTGATCTLGMQILLLPENRAEVAPLARLARDIGLDYLVVKPYSQHPSSKTSTYVDVDYAASEDLEQELLALRTDFFTPLVRLNAMRKAQTRDKAYGRCQALPFWSYLDSAGNIWGCSMFLGDERFLYGNIAEQSFAEIWNGPKRQASMDWFQTSFDCSGCRVNCRMDEVNRYLWELNNPSPHVNFI